MDISLLFPQLEISLKNRELNEHVVTLTSEGFSQVEIYDVYLQFALKLREENREDEEDYVNDVLDAIVGWCSYPIFPHYLTNEEIEEYRWQRYGIPPFKKPDKLKND